MDTFAEGAVIEPVVEGEVTQGGGTGSGIESFDDDVVIEPEDSKLSDSQLDGMEDEKEESKEEDKTTDDKKVEKEVEEKPEKEEKADDKKPDGKTLRLRDSDGERIDIDANATVKVKVNGKNEFVSIEDLKSSYSGDKAYGEKFADIEERTRELKNESAQFQEERNEMVGKLEKIASMLDDENGNPLDALYYLVDSTGRDTLDFNKRVMDYMSDEVHNLDGMDETERQLYWRDKEVSAIRSNQAAKAEQLEQTNAQRESIAKIDQLRESHGVSEDQFIESHSELESLGHTDASPQQVLNYTVMKPHYEASETICSEYEDDLGDNDYDSLIDTVANTLKNYPRMSEERALKTSLNHLGWDYEEEDAQAKRISDKANFTQESDVKKNYQYGSKNNENPESFDDWD